MLSITNILLLMTALFNAGLALFILRQNWRDRINLFFGVFLCALAVWAAALIGTQIGPTYEFWLYCTKITYISALVIGVSFYFFSFAFPDEKLPSVTDIYAVCGLPIIFSVALLMYPQFLTKEIVTYPWGNGVILGLPEYLAFAALFCALYVGGLIRIWIKYRRAIGLPRTQLLVIWLSVTITGLGGMYYNLLLPSPFFNDSRYIWTGPLFTTSIAIMIMYAIFRLRLFNAKVIVTELLIGLLWIFTFLRTLLAANQPEQIWNGGLFTLALIIGYLLIRSVQAEVRAREKIETLAGDLEVANRQQESLIHFISHEVKGALGKCSGIMSLILDGDYGPAPARMAEAVANGLTHTREAADMLTTILLSASLKTGAISFNMRPFSFKNAVQTVVDSLKREAEARHLKLECSFAEADCTVIGDETMLTTHVIRNLIDNAIRYTPEGTVQVLLQASPDSLALSVKDSGVGLTEEDKSLLFTAGGRGKDSVKVNVNSTGYGLFFAKQIVEAHHGTISADSEGRGKGSTFTVTFPRATI